PPRLAGGLELVEKARLADPGLGDYCDNLALPRLRQLGGVLHRLHLALATHEPRVTACRGALEASAQRPQPGDFIDFQRLADPLDTSGPQPLECEVALNHLAQRVANRDRARRCQRLEASCDAS